MARDCGTSSSIPQANRGVATHLCDRPKFWSFTSIISFNSIARAEVWTPIGIGWPPAEADATIRLVNLDTERAYQELFESDILGVRSGEDRSRFNENIDMLSWGAKPDRLLIVYGSKDRVSDCTDWKSPFRYQVNYKNCQ